MRRKVIADAAGALSALEEICAACADEGRIPARRNDRSIELGGTCNDCQGSGIKPTEDGRLLHFSALTHPMSRDEVKAQIMIHQSSRRLKPRSFA